MKHLLSQNAFWIVNKRIANEVGLDAALLLSDLITKEEYFLLEGNLSDDGWFFNTADNIKEDTTLSYYKQKIAIKTLEEKGFIETKLIGVPAKLHFKIFENKISNFLKTEIEKTSKLYNKNKTNKNKLNNTLFPENEFSGNVEKEKPVKTKKEKKKIAPKKEKKTDPLFAPFRKIFEDKFKEQAGIDYYWNVKDSVAINKLIKQVRFAYKSAGNENPTDDEMIAAISAIYDRALADRWIKDNFEPAIISSKFNNLVKSDSKQNRMYTLEELNSIPDIEDILP